MNEIMSEITTTTKIGIANNGSDANLLCPRCNGSYIHQAGATFYHRGEDAENTVEITVDGAETSTKIVPSSISPNPSSRRHGFSMKFSCESCSQGSDDIVLSIAQHKGETEISWSYPPKSED